MGLFGNLQVRVDPWEVEYGSELPLEAVPEEAPDDVAIDVELAPEKWQAIVPPPETARSRTVFVDGVRRIDTRLIVRRAGGVCHGAFGSYAVGAVAVTNSRATHERLLADRVVVVGSGPSVQPLRKQMGPYEPSKTRCGWQRNVWPVKLQINPGYVAVTRSVCAASPVVRTVQAAIGRPGNGPEFSPGPSDQTAYPG